MREPGRVDVVDVVAEAAEEPLILHALAPLADERFAGALVRENLGHVPSLPPAATSPRYDSTAL